MLLFVGEICSRVVVGAVKAFDAAADAGVKRFIIVSALDVRDKSKAQPDWYDEKDQVMSGRVWGAIGPYLEASKLGLCTRWSRGDGLSVDVKCADVSSRICRR